MPKDDIIQRMAAKAADLRVLVGEVEVANAVEELLDVVEEFLSEHEMNTPLTMSVDDPDAHYYPNPEGNYPIGGGNIITYDRLVKHIQQAGEHAMIHAHAEDADVFCMDHDCEVWGPANDETAGLLILGETVTSDEDGQTIEGTFGVFDPGVLEYGEESDAFVDMSGIVGDQARALLDRYTLRVTTDSVRELVDWYWPYDHVDDRGDEVILYRADVGDPSDDEPYVRALSISGPRAVIDTALEGV